jgi:hypothetical protein
MALAVAAGLSFGFELANFTLSIDEEYGLASGIGAGGWVAQDRYTMGLLKWAMRTERITPYWNTALAVIILYGAVLAWCFALGRMMKGQKPRTVKTALMIFGGLAISFPAHAYFMSFATYNVEVALGIFLSALAVDWMARATIEREGSWRELVKAAGVVVIVMGIYQSFLALIILGLLACWWLKQWSQDSEGKQWTLGKLTKMVGKWGAVLIVSVVIYFLINKFLHLFMPASNYYADNYWKWGNLTAGEFYWKVRNYLYDVLFNYDFWFGRIWAGAAWGLVVVGIIGMVKNWRAGWKQAVAMVGMLAMPFIFFVILGAMMPLRTNQAIAWLVGIAGLNLFLVSKNKWWRRVVAVGAAWLILIQSKEISTIFYFDHWRYTNDQRVAAQIAERVWQLDASGETPVYYVGKLTNKSALYKLTHETIGHTFLDATGEGVSRLPTFMKLEGYEFARATAPIGETAQRKIEQMPSWPAEGAVASESGIIIVKLAD